LPEWITVGEALALRGESLIRALRGGDIHSEGRDNLGHWVVMASATWCDDAIFPGELGFPTLDGRTVQGIDCAFWRGRWREIRLRRAAVEALPKSPEMIQRTALDWLLRRAAETQCRLKQRAEFEVCQTATGCTWRDYLAAFRLLPEGCRYKRGQR
jgi:hypothetical protein